MITVFGSNVLDLFFQVADLPPHDQALHLDSHIEQPGGKGANQAVACAKAGANVNFYGAVGDGGHGRQMYKNLASYGINVSGLKVLPDETSGLACIFVDDEDGTHRVVVSQGANKKIKADWVPDAAIETGNILLMQGEIKMVETEALCLRAKKNGATTIINLAPVVKLSDLFLQNLDFLIVNEHEADALGADIGVESEDKTSFAKEMFERYAVSTIVTLGGDGAICCHDGKIMKVSALKVKAVDTIGAGDAFVGYFCAALDKGQTIESALSAASIAGSLACTKIGAQSALPSMEDVAGYAASVAVAEAA
ncbi:MAG: ribokinase [Alphaproteobacteria bacterium]|nr:ribokinase [Alphaproteobacteria bacterium]